MIMVDVIVVGIVRHNQSEHVRPAQFQLKINCLRLTLIKLSFKGFKKKEREKEINCFWIIEMYYLVISNMKIAEFRCFICLITSANSKQTQIKCLLNFWMQGSFSDAYFIQQGLRRDSEKAKETHTHTQRSYEVFKLFPVWFLAQWSKPIKEWHQCYFQFKVIAFCYLLSWTLCFDNIML